MGFFRFMIALAALTWVGLVAWLKAGSPDTEWWAFAYVVAPIPLTIAGIGVVGTILSGLIKWAAKQ